MNIYVISPNKIWGGAATANIAIAQMLSKGNTVYYNDEYFKVETEGVVYDDYPTHRTKDSAKLVEYLLSKKIDVVIWGIAMNLPFFRCATKELHKSGVKQAVIFHSLAIVNTFKGKLMEWLITRSLKYIDHLVFVSEYTDVSWSKYRGVRCHKNHHTLYNPAVPVNTKIEKSQVCNRIGFVGRFSTEKQPAIFAELSNADKDNKYIAWGDGPLLNELKPIYRQVEFKGQGNCHKEIYSSFDILVMTSKFENCPMVILESRKYGIPCVVPKVGGIPEIVKDSYDGVLYTEYSSKSIHECIEKIQREYDKYSNNCIESVKRFSFDVLYERWMNMLNNK